MSAATAPGRAVPPGPDGVPVLGNLLDFARDTFGALLSAWREYGDIVYFRGRVHPFFPLYFFAHPDHVKHVLADNAANYHHPPVMSDKWRHVVGNGIIALEDDIWTRQRKLSNTAFKPERLAAYDGLITDSTQELVERWRGFAARGEPVEVQAEMKHHVLHILAQALVGADMSKEGPTVEDTVTAHVKNLDERMNQPIDIPEGAPLPSQRRFMRARAVLDSILEERMRDTEAHGDDGSMLSQLVRARDEGGRGMGEDQARYDVKTFFIAGLETTAITLAWTLYLLSKHPHVERRLREELDQVLGGRKPTADDVKALQYTTQAIKETLRLYPPLWIVPRVALGDDEIGGYHVPAGAHVTFTAYVTNRHPEFWDNPEAFDPERFSPEASKGRHKFAWIPFGGGPRGCIGFPFALMEMPLVLAQIMQNFEVTLVPGYPVEPEGALSLKQRNGALMKLRSLDGATAG